MEKFICCKLVNQETMLIEGRAIINLRSICSITVFKEKKIYTLITLMNETKIVIATSYYTVTKYLDDTTNSRIIFLPD